MIIHSVIEPSASWSNAKVSPNHPWGITPLFGIPEVYPTHGIWGWDINPLLPGQADGQNKNQKQVPVPSTSKYQVPGAWYQIPGTRYQVLAPGTRPGTRRVWALGFSLVFATGLIS
jgi:hypothetical protein